MRPYFIGVERVWLCSSAPARRTLLLRACGSLLRHQRIRAGALDREEPLQLFDGGQRGNPNLPLPLTEIFFSDRQAGFTVHVIPV